MKQPAKECVNVNRVNIRKLFGQKGTLAPSARPTGGIARASHQIYIPLVFVNDLLM